MARLVLVSAKPLAGKTTLTAGLSQNLRALGKSVALERRGEDANSASDSAAFGRSTSEVSSAEITLTELPATDTPPPPDQGARVLVVAGSGTPPAEIAEYCRAIGEQCAGVLLNRLPQKRMDAARLALGAEGLSVLGLIPEDRLLATPSLSEVVQALAGRTEHMDSNGEKPLDRPLIASISADPGQGYFTRYGATSVIVRSDKPDLQLAALNAGATCLIITGGLPVLHYVLERASEETVPLIQTNKNTLETVAAVEALYASTPFTGGQEKVKRAAELLADVDLAPLIG